MKKKIGEVFLRYFLTVLAIVAHTVSHTACGQGISENQAPIDSAKVNELLDIAYSLEIENPDSALSIYAHIVEVSQSIPYTIAQGKGHLYSGIVHSDQGRYDKSIEAYLKSIEVFESVEYREGVASAYINLGNIEKRKAQYGKAVSYYLDGTRILESLRDTNRLLIAYANLGAILSNVEQFDKSLEYNQKSVDLSRKLNDSIRLCSSLINVGMVYIETQKPDSAKFVHEEALKIALSVDDVHSIFLIKNNLSTIAANENDYVSALKYAKESYDYAKTLNNPVFLSQANDMMGRWSFFLNDLDSAQLYINKSLELADKNESIETYMSSLQIMVQIQDSLGNHDGALENLKKLRALEQEEARARQKNVIAGLEIEYESERKDLAIAEKNLEIEKNKAEIDRRNYLIAALVALLAVAVIIFVLVRKSLAQKKELAENEAKLKTEKLNQLAKEKEVSGLKSMLEGEDKERSRLAKDLHDGLGSMLSATKLRFNKIQLNHSELNTSKDYTEALELIDQTSQEARRISHNLMPGALEKFGLKEALNDLCENIKASTGMEVTLEILDISDRGNGKLEKNIYRIIQELVSNAAKHAEAKEILVQLMQVNEDLHITVEDDGKGFHPSATSDGLGLRSIKSRIEFIEGELEVDSKIGEGSTFRLVIPVNQKP